MSICTQNDLEEKRMYTYDDYQKKKQEYGFTPDQISDADDRLARYNPDAGMALLGYKNDWLTASNDSAKAMAHAAAEDIRSRYGNYSGGGNGGSFTPTGTAKYEDPWEVAVQSTIKNMQNRKFQWSPETDPSAKYYTDMYRREGERAMKDVLGAVASTTGGIPSSYATAAAAQQRNYYAQALTDKYPELYKQAFDRFMQEYDNEYKMLDAYATLSEHGYGRWSDTQERNRNARLDAAAAQQQAFENDLALEELAIQNEELRIMADEFNLSVQKFDHEKQMAIKDDAYRWAALIQEGKIAEAEQEYRNSALALEEKGLAWDYAVNMAKISEDRRQFDANTQYNYDVLAEERRQSDANREHQAMLALIEEELARDQLAADISDRELEEAVIAAGYGDFTKLEDRGIETNLYREAFEKAMQEQLGDAGENVLEETGDITENDVIDAYVQGMRRPVTVNGFDLNQSTIDSLAAKAPEYKARADADKAIEDAKPENRYKADVKRYNELLKQTSSNTAVDDALEQEELRKRINAYQNYEKNVKRYNALEKKRKSNAAMTLSEVQELGLLEREIAIYNENYGG